MARRAAQGPARCLQHTSSTAPRGSYCFEKNISLQISLNYAPWSAWRRSRPPALPAGARITWATLQCNHFVSAQSVVLSPPARASQDYCSGKKLLLHHHLAPPTGSHRQLLPVWLPPATRHLTSGGPAAETPPLCKIHASYLTVNSVYGKLRAWCKSSTR
jgi:hypothetical protein